MTSAGSIVRAVDFTAAVIDTQATSGTTTSTSYTATLTGGTACGTAFTAPTSGKVTVHNVCQISNSGGNDTWCGWVLRTGSAVGSGTTVSGYSADDSRALLHNGTTVERNGSTLLVTGLTPGAAYNVQQQFRVAAGTGTFANKTLSVTSEN